MKLIHCADMHLDSALATSLTRQEARRRNDELFETFIKMMDYAQREKVRAVLVAGDLFDSENGREAVKKKVLEAVAAHPQVDFLVLSGNHDGEQLFNTVPDSGFNMTVNGNSLPKNLKLFPGAGKAYRYGNVVITGLNSLKLPSNLHLKPEDTNIVMMHGQIDRFGSFAGRNIDYLALGHIHRPQRIMRDTVRYCGTPLKYSFSEAGHEKSLTVVELAEKGNVSIQHIPLTPKHDMREIRGAYMELTDRAYYRDMDREDYLHITLTDEEDIPDAVRKLQVIYPNLMKLDYDNARTRGNQVLQEIEAIEKKSPMELFAEFYETQNNQPMDEEQFRLMQEIMEQVWEDKA